nr:InlB B-repeat-containing protein [Candidatus Enterousia merdequi]
MTKHILRFLFVIFTFINISTVYADTETLNWYIDDNIYATTTCESGSDIILPTTPTKYGYTFKGWRSYIPIKYLANTDSQFIDTNIHMNSNWSATIIGSFTGFGCTIMGDTGSSFSNGMFRLFPAGSSGDSAWGGTSTSTISNKMHLSNNINTLHTITIDKYRIVVDNQETNFFSPPYGETVSNKNFRLFRTGGSYDRCISRIHSFYIKDNSDNLIMDLIPVLDENGIPCMFDQVEGKFYYNAGTGDFIAGPVIDE